MAEPITAVGALQDVGALAPCDHVPARGADQDVALVGALDRHLAAVAFAGGAGDGSLKCTYVAGGAFENAKALQAEGSSGVVTDIAGVGFEPTTSGL